MGTDWKPLGTKKTQLGTDLGMKKAASYKAAFFK
jgi:hypothetical protein